MDKIETLKLWQTCLSTNDPSGTWNAWARDAQRADDVYSPEWIHKYSVNFSNHVFEEHAFFGNFVFPSHAFFDNAEFKKRATFADANFNYIADFSSAKFCDEALFLNARFESYARFQKSRFSKLAIFRGASFHRYASFSHASFLAPAVFRSCLFKENAEFGDVKFKDFVTFQDSQFYSMARFSNASFLGEDIFFWNAEFQGNTEFIGTVFKGRVGFNGTHFFKDADFERPQFKSNAAFSRSQFDGGAYFINIEDAPTEQLSFKGSSFNGLLEISSHYEFSCIVDLIGTKTSHHVDLSGLKCQLPQKNGKDLWWFKKCDWTHQKIASDKEDIARARRLKELAEANKDHIKAKDFQVIELQAMREHKYPYDFLLKSEFYYEKFSDYGRSVTRPLGWLAFVTWLWAVFYSILSFLSAVKLDVFETVSKSFIFSFAQIFPFVQASRKAHQDVAADLFGKNHDWIYFFTFAESFLGFVLLFLLGLGLRHKYKI